MFGVPVGAADRDEDADAGTDVALVCKVGSPARLVGRGSAWKPAGDVQAQQVLIGGPPPYSALASSRAPIVRTASGSLW
jgi:hypothetical protein